MPRKPTPFRVERRGCAPQCLNVHTDDIATVHIKREDEGIVIDVYPLRDFNNEPVASVAAHHHALFPTEFPDVQMLTPWQRTALMTYDLGEFAYLAEATDGRAFRDSLRDCGDGLLRFIVSELSQREDCENYQDAIRRVTSARNQLNDLIEQLQKAAKMPDAHSPSPRYSLSWHIDSDAADPVAAAREALALQRDPRSTATVFKVRDNHNGEEKTVDLAEEETIPPSP